VADRVRTAFIFGSVAKGGEIASSDIDVMVIGDVGFGEVVS
jgi:predicted nucleotidyltransferase